VKKRAPSSTLHRVPGNLLYLIGQPGSGKSTLADAILSGLSFVEHDRPFAHRLYPDAALVELGAHRDSFSGTDALPMNVQPKVVDWLARKRIPYVLGEGDRLANRKFLDAAVAAGWRVNVAYLSVGADVAEKRRLARASSLGVAPQDASWVKGRVTKARNLARGWPDVYMLNAERAPVELLADLLRYGDPVVTTVMAARPPR
jgi:energy-coupling factor transporter ATP-binding protein EcfA2